jgi:RNA polymerase sigma-70 factor (ECF subfamily)
MNTTSTSLLDRLKHAKPDGSDWRKLQRIYQPLIVDWLARVPGLDDAVQELSTEVLVALSRKLPFFKRERDGSFRVWLRRITVSRVRAFWRAARRGSHKTLGEDPEQLLCKLEDPKSDLARQWDREHDQHVFHQLLAIVQADFAPNTWRAFTRFALDGQPAARVARELRMSVSAVVQAKSRVLKRLRKEAGELID